MRPGNGRRGEGAVAAVRDGNIQSAHRRLQGVAGNGRHSETADPRVRRGERLERPHAAVCTHLLQSAGFAAIFEQRDPEEEGHDGHQRVQSGIWILIETACAYRAGWGWWKSDRVLG